MNLVPLSNVGNFINGRAFKPEEWEIEGLPIIRIQNLTGSTNITNYFSGDFDSRHLVKNGDVLISWSASLGVYFWNGGNAILNQHIFKVDLYKGVDKQYFYYAATHILDEMASKVHGSTMQHITKEPFESTLIPLPPLPEQQRIAAILQKADRLRRLRRYARQMSDTYLQSVFLEMFGDIKRNPYNWDCVSIGQIAKIIVPTRDKPKSFTGTIPWVTLPDIKGLFIENSRNCLTTEEADEVSNRLMPKDTILLSCAGSLGNVVISSREVYANQQFYGFVANTTLIHPYYLAYSLITLGEDFFFSLAGVSVLGFFSKEKALGIKIMLPPEKIQKKFVEILLKYQTLNRRQQESERQAEHLFQSLLQRAFQGEL